ncbi:replicative DNA helicase [Candidatus Uhrbacteria bacterium RIFCSPLOWO2_12_FULL_46_10]|uniref:Replicative DNA helicase n=1 Tax=Candidatus Uhrbacteria bacterium RIFCSPLOWO2_01_FULL_47_25 TaxID=1802402 RepID=A0A1F7UXI5_9BACT|nr:MAG: replicative DNA helicase [Candidatus Uhrbacteria bacterium RIFCSPHIGHO2_01_FULL_46_23]OGL70313.1 MAG: replicative DNA helicase [Candidatus Uhrbacteria bacterium RIFCSPHIGHO2_02_FULL_47_29]OGL75099.1 MAG: replicative DNA helicase [Candidatus Uhrbacteria bacterium RIFCSPHIGHO2_12_FULL_46_13]OGL83000.1 MAG: replicative DNA helicase [Candidatus Uhrbacteria bacterium RIFCSPLOWO2_01_FULL_47_25]OGL84446.1 MAG: replicative DNA helicase [Candidatus Uhrbacteria bacterium RIFCSPLOWO2_02_FULL_46_19
MPADTNEVIKVPPQNLEAEQSLLGALLLDKEAVFRVIDLVTAEDFYRDAHRFIYEAMMDLFLKHEPIDILSISNRLDEKKQLQIIGGQSYLVSLVNAVPTAAHADNYAGIVQRKATLRRLLEAGVKITGLGYEEEPDIDNTLDQAERTLFSVTQKYLRHVFISIKSLLNEAFERIDELHHEGGKLRGIPTQFKELDAKLAGMQKSDLIILAARPSVGKTSLALDIARHAAIQSKIPVGIFSLEMSKEQLVDRMLCAEAGVDLWRMRTGRLSDKGDDNDFSRIGHAMDVLSNAPIYIDDGATANIMEIRARARRLQMEKGLGLLIIDYLQLMESRTKSDNRVQEISEITRALKSLARELNIPILALSQLSRAVEARSPAIPKLADLRDSGTIEQDADVVLFIYRKAMDRSVRDVSPEERNIAQIRIEKHRNGPTGVVELYFDEGRVSFQNLERQQDQGVPVF